MAAIRLALAVAIALLIAPMFAVEGGAAALGHVVTSWSSRNGLPAGRIWSVASDRHGYVWLGTESGLIRFDGVEFLSWLSVAESDELSEQVLSVIVSADGAIWVGFGGNGGVARVRGRYVERFGVDAGLQFGFVSALLEDRDGRIWAGGQSGLYYFRDGKWVQISQSDGLPSNAVHVIHEDPAGTLWVSTSGGLFRRTADNDQFALVDSLPDFLKAFGSTLPSILSFDRTSSEGSFSESYLVSKFAHDNGPGGRVLHGRRGDLWLGTAKNGVWHLRPDAESPHVAYISTQQGLSSNVVLSLYEDAAGRVWVATDAGLDQLSPRLIDEVREVDSAMSLVAGADGSVWVATDDGVLRLQGDTRHRYTTADGLPGGAVQALLRDSRGVIWAAAADGIARFTGSRFERIDFDVQLPQVFAMAADARGRLWLCDTYKGVFALREDQLVAVPTIDKGRTALTAAASDSAERLWLGFAGGTVGYLDSDGRFSRVQNLSGPVRFILEDRRGVIWIGGADGLRWLDEGRFVPLVEPASHWSVNTMVQDRDGALWVGTNEGITRIDFAAIAQAPSRSTASALHYRSFDESDGLPGVVRTRAAAAESSDGRLWFVTSRGRVAVIEPGSLGARRPGGRARIDAIMVAGRRLEPTPNLALPPRTPELRIAYTSLTYGGPSQVQFRYMLKGFETAWKNAGSERIATYTNLPPGQYEFRLIAMGRDGITDTSEAGLVFFVQPAVYQTRWFLALCVGLVGVGAWALWRVRLRQYQKQFQVVLEERARISREVHDTLLQSLVAAVLQFDVMALRVSEPVRSDLLSLRRELQAHLKAARQSIWNLRAASRSTGLVEALRRLGEDLKEREPMRFHFEVSGVPRSCSPRVHDEVVQIAREALVNIVRHADATEVRFELKYKRQSMRLRISDNGRGFDPSTSQDDEPQHFGILGMKERARGVGGDVTLVAESGHGTSVNVVVPVG